MKAILASLAALLFFLAGCTRPAPTLSWKGVVGETPVSANYYVGTSGFTDFPDQLVVKVQDKTYTFAVQRDRNAIMTSPVGGRPDSVRGCLDVFTIEVGGLVNNYFHADKRLPAGSRIARAN